MTPACRLLKNKKVAFSVHEYVHDSTCVQYGLEAADKLNLPVAQVFKTLLLSDGEHYYVVVLPVSHQMSLKKAAQALGCKKLSMATHADATRVTGYVVGGISPLGQKKQLKTLLDQSATHYDTIYVSGGKRGLDIGLAPDDLCQLTRANYADVLDQA